MISRCILQHMSLGMTQNASMMDPEIQTRTVAIRNMVRAMSLSYPTM